MLSFSEWCVCVCVLFIYTISISINCVSREQPSLIPYSILSTDIWLLQVNNFYKEKTLRKVFFNITELSIQCNKDSCCEYITGGVNIYLFGCVSLIMALECAVRVCVRVISNQSTNKKQHCVWDLCKLDALLHKAHIKVLLVLRYHDLTCVDS